MLTECAYTDESVTEEAIPTDAVTYGYDIGAWGDLLTSYDGTGITYDGIGNPEKLHGWNLTWEHGRQLASMSKSGPTWNFTYNADGLRTKRAKGLPFY